MIDVYLEKEETIEIQLPETECSCSNHQVLGQQMLKTTSGDTCLTYNHKSAAPGAMVVNVHWAIHCHSKAKSCGLH